MKRIPPALRRLTERLIQKECVFSDLEGDSSDTLRLAQNGVFLAYGDAVAIGEKAVLICGYGGSGKTVLAEQFRSKLGASILVNDSPILYHDGQGLPVVYEDDRHDCEYPFLTPFSHPGITREVELGTIIYLDPHAERAVQRIPVSKITQALMPDYQTMHLAELERLIEAAFANVSILGYGSPERERTREEEIQTYHDVSAALVELGIIKTE